MLKVLRGLLQVGINRFCVFIGVNGGGDLSLDCIVYRIFIFIFVKKLIEKN